MTLNTFHSSGMGNKAVTTGIPRLKELINVTKVLKTPGMTVYLQEPYASDYNLAQQVRAKMEYTNLSQIVIDSKVLYDPDYTNTTIEEDVHFLSVITDIPDPDMPKPNELYSAILRLSLSREAMAYRGLTMNDVVKAIYENLEKDYIFILHSDDNDNNLIIHIRIYKDIIEETENNPTTLQNYEENCYKFFECSKLVILECICLCGIISISKAFVQEKNILIFDENVGSYIQTKKFTIETDGINIYNTLLLPEIDPYQIYCNNPQKMCSTFGIEMARETLMLEIKGVIEGGGSSVNYRHLALLCELMTNRGQIMSITRHGINKTNVGVLMKATFEQTIDMLFDAAINGEIDPIKGVSENIFMGKIIPSGTGMMDLYLDVDKLKEIPGNEEETEVNEIMKDEIVENYNPLQPSYFIKNNDW